MPCGLELWEEIIELVDVEVEEGFVRLRKEKSMVLVRPSRQPTEIPTGTVSKVQGNDLLNVGQVRSPIMPEKNSREACDIIYL